MIRKLDNNVNYKIHYISIRDKHVLILLSMEMRHRDQLLKSQLINNFNSIFSNN